jgi:hypothetical protein
VPPRRKEVSGNRGGRIGRGRFVSALSVAILGRQKAKIPKRQLVHRHVLLQASSLRPGASAGCAPHPPSRGRTRPCSPPRGRGLRLQERGRETQAADPGICLIRA